MMVLPDAHSVVHHDGRENDRKGEGGGIKAVDDPRCGGKGADGGRVRARHTSGFPKALEAELARANGIEDGFDALRQKPGEYGAGEKGVKTQQLKNRCRPLSFAYFENDACRSARR